MKSSEFQPGTTVETSPMSRIPNEDTNPNAYQLYRRVLWTHPDQGEAIWGNVRTLPPEIIPNAETDT